MRIVQCSATFTRPADTNAYTSGDLVANNVTAGSVTPMTFTIPNGQGFKLWRVGIDRSATAVTNAQFKLHLYKDLPTVTNGDNGALSSIKSGYLGFVAVDGSGKTFSDAASAYSALTLPVLIYADFDQFVYGLLEATAAYTPASAEVFVVTLVGESYQ